MNLRQLKYFVRVVELQNMTRAAESLHVAQPALSQQMSLLEENLGVALLVRGAKGVQPTAEGLLLYRHAQIILRQVDSTRSLLSRTADQITGTVSIGLASSTARMLALPLMRRVKAELPSVVLEIVDVPSADLTKLVLQGRIDFSLSPDQQPMQGLLRTPLLRERLFLLAHASVALPRRTLAIEDFAALPLVLPSLPNTLRARLDHAFLTAGLTCNLFAEASTSAILIPAVREAMAATILPSSAAQPEIAEGSIVAHALDRALSRELVLCASASLPPSPAVNRVIELCQDEIKRLIEDQAWQGCTLLR
ncbi:LysR family transcriptional regulator [Achromobacter sp. HZ01]|uniref:LysR substrate-binding domain-containing protein n=1 Tax=Achromobacter sp. HZ01 TaxID=1416886 RepID=UPI000DC3F181|nr:LysR substrate-binding domain-containing protein [Achromobacter sp. HZ01]MBO9331907.1 LysR family transcriptional regulator [Achromobacter xylosoxidans]RAP59865.1 LysR family transcriptional regulator [Achromobacter sp. HZ01]